MNSSKPEANRRNASQAIDLAPHPTKPRKTILVISYEWGFPSSVASHRAKGFVDSLSRAGHEVTILTCKELTCDIGDSPRRIIKVPNPLLRLLKTRFSSANNATHPFALLLQLFNRFRKKTGILFLGRMPDISDFWQLKVKSELKTQNKQWDVVIGSYAPYSCLAIGSFCKRRGFAKVFIADYRDPWIDHHLFKGLAAVRSLEKLLETKIIANTDRIIKATPNLSQREPFKNAICIKNGFSGNLVERRIKRPRNEIIAIHAGSIYPHMQSLGSFFLALKKYNAIAKKQIKIHFAGNEAEYIREQCDRYCLGSFVEIHGPLHKLDCEALLLDADVGLSFDINNLEHSGTIPVKLSEYLRHRLRVMQVCYTFENDAVAHLDALKDRVYCSYDTNSIYRGLLEIANSEPCNHEDRLLERFSQRYHNDLLLGLLDDD